MDAAAFTLRDIVDAPAVQSLLDDFYRLAGIPLAIIDREGGMLVGAGWSDICTRFHRVNPDTCRNCVESDTLLTTGVPEGEFRLYKCKNHMWDVSTPIIVDGRHIGNVFSGQFFFDDETVDREVFRAQAVRYGFDEDEYLSALDAVPRLSHEAIETGMSFFAKLARFLSDEGYNRIRLGQAHAELLAAHEAIAERERDLERRVTERTGELERLTQRFGSVLEMLPGYVVLISPDYHVLFANRYFEERFGKSGGRRCYEYLFELDAPCQNCETFKVLQKHEPVRWEWDGPDGRKYDIYDYPFTDSDGSPLIMEMGIDITERKQAEEKERLYAEQRRIAEQLQRALLDVLEPRAGVSFGHLYQSATRDAAVGGDFYDVFEVKDGQLAVLIGDVSGHGVEAARAATLTKDVIHAFAHQFRRPSVILAETNELLIEKYLTGFVTLFLGIIDRGSGRLTYASAGHPNGLIARAQGTVEYLEARSAPLGVFADRSWQDHQVRVEKGDALFLYTDGVFEARRDGELYGQERIAQALANSPGCPPADLPRLVLADVLDYSRGELTDDVAMLALSLTPDA